MSAPSRPADALPGHPHIVRRGDTLMIEALRADELARRFGTPLYVYSRAAIEQAARQYEDAARDHPLALRYSVKANSSKAILQLLQRRGWGFDVVSGGELARVLDAGGSADKVVFSGVGKTDAELLAALRAGVQCINVESTSELERIDRLAGGLGVQAPISLRVNPDVDPRTHPYISTGLRTSKFGIDQAQARQAYARCAQLRNLRVLGIDVHIGSQITTLGPYLDALDRVLELVRDIEHDGIRLHHLDLGGGLGIRYAGESPPAPGEWIAALSERLRARGQGHRALLVEPGRSVVGNSGVLLCRAITLKSTLERHFAVVDDFSWRRVLQDAAIHPFVLAGFSALLLLLPLAATSTQGMVRRLGAARWRALHRLVYLVGVLAVFHYWWGKLAKNNTADPKGYALLLALLLGWRLAYALRRRLRRG